MSTWPTPRDIQTLHCMGRATKPLWGVREPLKSSAAAHGELTEHFCPSHTILASFGNSVSKYLGRKFQSRHVKPPCILWEIIWLKGCSDSLQTTHWPITQSSGGTATLKLTEAATVFNIAAIASRASFLLDLLDVRGSSISCKYLAVHFSLQFRLWRLWVWLEDSAHV